jgi:hypothetical protein
MRISLTSTEMNTSGETKFDVARTRSPTTFSSNVILHAGLGINFQLDGLNRTTETKIILPCILIISIILWVVDMLLGPIDSKAFFSYYPILESVSID